MEINQRMSKRFAWLLGAGVLVLVAVLVACGTNYSSSSDGLVLVGSQGSGLIESFSFNLNSGSVSAISNPPSDTSNSSCVLNGLPSSLVVDPAGSYAYTIILANSLCDTAQNPTQSQTGLLAFKLNSDGTIATAGSLVSFNQISVTGPSGTVTVAVMPSTISMDAAGKYLFVADRGQSSAGQFVPGAVSVFSIGSGGALTEVAGSPFIPATTATVLPASGLDIISVAPTPTVYPAIGINGVQNAPCSNIPPPTAQYLYAVDTVGNQVLGFSVDSSTGILTFNAAATISTATSPVGSGVDPCNRFVYVSDSKSNQVNGYAICNGSVTAPVATCGVMDGRLVPVAGSPFSLSGSPIYPGPLVIDPFGKFIYVLNTGSNTIDPLQISPISGGLSAANPVSVATGTEPISIAIRKDDNWLFVTNFNPPSVSQYSVTPNTGALNALPVIPTDNYPWGIAVK